MNDEIDTYLVVRRMDFFNRQIFFDAFFFTLFTVEGGKTTGFTVCFIHPLPPFTFALTPFPILGF